VNSHTLSAKGKIMAKDAKIGQLVLALGQLREEAIGSLVDLARRFSGDDGRDWESLVSGAVKEGLKKTVVAAAVAAALLVLVGNPVSISPSVEKFIAAKKLVVNTTPTSELKISYLGDNFKSWFLGKVEEPFAGSQLKLQKLRQNSVDKPILDELGGEEKAEVLLYEAFNFLKTADQNLWYLFYIKDAGRRLCAVNARWDGGGWCLRADEFHDPHHWGADARVVSRNFDPVSA
jgi:hypothetical protein